MESAAFYEPAAVRTELLDRRRRLERVVTPAAEAQAIAHLLDEVDQALARVDAGTFGVCEVCHGTVEPERIAADPLLRTCFDCMSAAQKGALERDLDLAGQVQRQLLPARQFRSDGWDAAYEYQAMGPASGDYIDLFPLDSGEVIFVVGDVSGKGVAASLLMTHLHATMRSLVALQLPFEELLERTNRMFFQSVGAKQYATLLCVKAGLDGELTLANAGHCPPIVVGEDRAFTVPATSVPIGLFTDVPFPTERLQLRSGETLLVYTDGITEAVDSVGREYSCDRLVAAATRHQGLEAHDLVQHCLGDLAQFRGSSDRHDDVTLFALRRR